MKKLTHLDTKPRQVITTGAAVLAVAGITTVMTGAPVQAATLPTPSQATPGQPDLHHQAAVNQALVNQLKADQTAIAGQHSLADSQALASYQQQMSAAATSAQTALTSAANAYSQAASDQSRANQSAFDAQNVANATRWQAAREQAAASQAAAREQAASSQSGALSQATADYQQAASAAIQERDQAQSAATAERAAGQDVINATPVAPSWQPAVGVGQPDQLSNLGKSYLPDNPQMVYPPLYLGLYGNVPADWFNQASANAALVGNENQLPTNFLPGLLIYDASHDTSSRIGAVGLSEEQKAILNDLSNQWMNSLRDYYYNVLHGNLLEGGLDSVTTTNGVHPATLKTERDFWNATQDLAQARENQNWSYDHTTKEYGNLNYAEVLGRAMGIQSGAWYAENLYVLGGHTMLEFEVNLYNRMQVMLYNELLQNPDGSYADPVGHLRNALNPLLSECAMGFQRVPTSTGQAYYNVIWEFMGTRAGNGLDQLATQMAGGHQTVATPIANRQSVGGWMQTGVVDRIQTAQHAGQSTQITRGQRQQALDQAYQTAVKTAQDRYQAQMGQLQAQLQARQAQINQDYATRLAAIDAQSNQSGQLRAQLDEDLAAVKAAGDAKLTQLQQAYEAQFAQIKAQLQARQAALGHELTATRVANQRAAEAATHRVSDQLTALQRAAAPAPTQSGQTPVNEPKVATPSAPTTLATPTTPVAQPTRERVAIAAALAREPLVLVNGTADHGVTVVDLPRLGTTSATSPSQPAYLTAPNDQSVARPNQAATLAPTALTPAPNASTPARVTALTLAETPAPAVTEQSLATTPVNRLGKATKVAMAARAAANSDARLTGAAITLVGVGLLSLAVQWLLGKKEW